MDKKILNKVEIQGPLQKGMDLLADIVKRTLGPGGLPVIIQRKGEALDGSPLGPRITKDGVSVAEECSDPDPAIDLAIQSVKDICKKTNRDAGDGTTTAITLGQALMLQMLAHIEETGDNPQLVRESLEAAGKIVIEKLKAMATPVSMDLLLEVATISANGDREIGACIQTAFKHVGAEGVVTVDEGVGTDLTVTLVDGYQFNRGAESQDAFFNNENRTAFAAEKEEGSAEETRVAVIIFDGKLASHLDLVNPLSHLAGIDPKTGKGTRKMPPVVILANEFSRDVITFLLIQKQERGMEFCAVRGPHMSDVRSGYYDDLACYTGGKRFGNGNPSLATATAKDIGWVNKAVVTNRTTTFFGGASNEAVIMERVKHLQARKAAAESPYDAQVIGDRLAALTNGIAKIGVGGATELEIKEKYDRIEDALNAARAAMLEGVVQGGGTAFLRIAESQERNTPGLEILVSALQEPFFQILRNVGLDGKEVDGIADSVLANPDLVYDSRNKVLVSAFEVGILDPVKVTRCALENAISIAGLLCTAGGAIIYVPENAAAGV